MIYLSIIVHIELFFNTYLGFQKTFDAVIKEPGGNCSTEAHQLTQVWKPGPSILRGFMPQHSIPSSLKTPARSSVAVRRVNQVLRLVTKATEKNGEHFCATMIMIYPHLSSPIFHSSQRGRIGRVREEKVWSSSCQRSKKASSAWRNGVEASREGEWSTDDLEKKVMWCERAEENSKLLTNSSNRGTQVMKLRDQELDSNQLQETVWQWVGSHGCMGKSIADANIALGSRKGWTGAGGEIC